jgi:uncharacterized membrane protein YtjA (UPF0391 family)
MLYSTLIFFLVALVAGVPGLGGFAGITVILAKVLYLFFPVLGTAS